METINFLGNDGKWHTLYDFKLDATLNLADLTDKEAARQNLDLYNLFISKDVAKNGREPGTIHHTMIMEDQDARFVTDKQVAYWNAKTNPPVTGTANFAGSGNTVTITHGIKDFYGKAKKPEHCEIVIRGNCGGRVGETWIDWTDTTITVGNTGSYTGQFTWVAYCCDINSSDM